MVCWEHIMGNLAGGPRVPPCDIHFRDLGSAQEACGRFPWCGGVVEHGGAWCHGGRAPYHLRAAVKIPGAIKTWMRRSGSPNETCREPERPKRPNHAGHHRSSTVASKPQQLSVALCVVGQARTLSDARIVKSQQDYLLAPLRAQARHFEVLAVVDPKDNLDLVASTYGIPTSKIKTHAVQGRWEQYERYTIVWRMLIEAEATNKRQFDWVIKTRPDFFFYGPLLGTLKLSDLDDTSVHCRMRCTLFSETSGKFDLNMISSENQQRMWRTCQPRPPNPRECGCTQLQCDATSFVIDDQAAIVPRVHSELFFNFDAFQNGGTYQTEANKNFTKRVGNCPSIWPWQACYQTALMVDNGVRLEPVSLRFTVARMQRADGANARLGPLFFDAALEHESGRQHALMEGAALVCS